MSIEHKPELDTPDVTGENNRGVDACNGKGTWNNRRTKATARRRPAASEDEVNRSGEGCSAAGDADAG